METLFAIKSNMTQTWDAAGKRLAVAVLQIPEMTVIQIKSDKSDGYTGIQVGFGTQKGKRVTQPLLKHLKKTATDTVSRHLKEIRLTDVGDLKVGDLIKNEDILKVGDYVKISGDIKGRGFAGAVKRHGFKGGPRTHGQSDRERAPGAIGQGTSPGRIHKGKRMAGHYGVTQFTIRNLQVIHLDTVKHELWLSGPVPGSRGSLLTVTKVKEGTYAA